MPTHHRQSQQYFLALIGFFAVAELETLRLWVGAAMVPGPSTGSHDCICGMQVLGADGLLYQSIDDLLAVAQSLNPDIQQFEASCFTGEKASFG